MNNVIVKIHRHFIKRILIENLRKRNGNKRKMGMCIPFISPDNQERKKNNMKKLKRSARKVVYALSPKKKEQEVWETMKQCSHIFNGFLIGKMIDSLII